MSLDNIILHKRSDMSPNSWITDDSYVLTKKGWKPVWSIKEKDVILCSNTDFTYLWKTVEEIEQGFKDIVELSHSFWKFKYSCDNKVFGYRRMTLNDNTNLTVEVGTRMTVTGHHEYIDTDSFTSSVMVMLDDDSFAAMIPFRQCRIVGDNFKKTFKPKREVM